MIIYKYPLNLDEHNSPFMNFKCYNWTNGNKRRQKINSKTTKIGSVYLPVSRGGLSENHSLNWDAADMVNIKTVKDFGIKKAVEKLTSIAEAFVSDVKTFTEYNLGAKLNDFSALTFSGNNFRELTVNWDFMPSSSYEANKVNDIIKFFQANSLPKYENWKILYPRIWTVELWLPNNKKLFNFFNCVVTDVSTDLFKDENLSVYTDGNTNRSLSVSFREILQLGRS